VEEKGLRLGRERGEDFDGVMVLLTSVSVREGLSY